MNTVLLIQQQHLSLLRTQASLDMIGLLSILVKLAIFVGDVPYSIVNVIGIQIASITDSTCRFVVLYEMAETVVRRVAIIQAGGVGDEYPNFFRSEVVLKSFNLAIPPTFITAACGEATLGIAFQSGSLGLLS